MDEMTYSDYDGKVSIISVEKDNKDDLEILGEVHVDDDLENTEKVIYLIKGEYERDDKSKLVEIKKTDDKTTVLVTDDFYGAIGMYLNYLEQYNLSEKEVH